MQALRADGLSARRCDAEGVAHARELAREAALARETVAVLGGDGLIGVVADALREVPGSTLGVLPAGRGNDLARVLGIPKDPLAACATIARGVPRAMDLGEVCAAEASAETPLGRRTFVGIASAGFDSEANRIANEASPRLGRLVYAYGALRALWRWRPARFEISLQPQGERHTIVGYSICAANSRAYGGGMRMAPDALLDDGQFDVVTIGQIGRLRLLVDLLRVFNGTHLREPAVRVFRAAELEISADRPFTLYADGDPIATLPVRLRSVGAALRVLVPVEHGVSPRGAGAARIAHRGPFSKPPSDAPAHPAEPAVQRAGAGDAPLGD